jgi:hypothetical protein
MMGNDVIDDCDGATDDDIDDDCDGAMGDVNDNDEHDNATGDDDNDDDATTTILRTMAMARGATKSTMMATA